MILILNRIEIICFKISYCGNLSHPHPHPNIPVNACYFKNLYTLASDMPVTN